MYFLIDKKLKIIFGWSAKCGCSHIKKIFKYLCYDKDHTNVHSTGDYNDLPYDVEQYVIILIIRNPYDRLVSGFLDKYNIKKPLRKQWPIQYIRFCDFVDKLVEKNWDIVDQHHFTPQTTENFNLEKLLLSKRLSVYDIKNIDYEYIESLYNKKIPEHILNFRGGHENKKTNLLEEYVYNLNMEDYNDYKVPTKYFYSNDIKEKVNGFFENDFKIFREFGFNYVLD